MKEIINYGIAGVGFVLYLSANDVDKSSIVVEIPTENEPLLVGGNADDKGARVTAVILTKSGIMTVTGTDDKHVVPTKIAKGRPIKIYEYGHYPEHFWTWEKTEETLMKLWRTNENGKEEIENVLFFVNETCPIWVGYAAAKENPEEEILKEASHLKHIVYG